MTEYDLKRLDSREFENLCADIIEKENGKRVERFTVGKDSGIDGRFWVGENQSVIIQAKHYPDATSVRIISALKLETNKVKALNPERYIFMTSGKVTPLKKAEMLSIMNGFIKGVEDIWGFDDIQSFLSKEENFDIVKKYTQLYIYSEILLKKILGQTIANALTGGLQGQSDFLLENIKKNSVRFVYTEDFDKAGKRLDEKNVVVITGEAGIGKTTLSNMLAFTYVKNGYSFYSIRNIKEAEDIVSANQECNIVFYFDDFLGENFMDISKGDDSSQIMLFMDRVARSKKLKFILNSRTTIINKARGIFPSLEKGNIKGSEYVLQIENLRPIDKARILYKHMYFSELDPDYVDQIYLEKKYWKIINHSNFNPRIIEYILEKERVEFSEIKSNDYFTYIEEKLDNPSDIWEDYFEKLDRCTKTLVLLVAFNNGKISESHLRNSFDIFCNYNKFSSDNEASFSYVIKVALDSLLSRSKVFDKNEFQYILFNPSLGDYIVENYFKNNESEINKLLFALSNIESIQYLESLKRNDYITDLEFKYLQKNLFESLYKSKLAKKDWNWLVCLIHCDENNLASEKIIEVLSSLTTLEKEESQSLNLIDFYKLYYILSFFETEFVPEKFDFLWAYLNSNIDNLDFEHLFRYFYDRQIQDKHIAEHLALLYEDHILYNIEDHLDIDYTKYVDFIAPDDYEVDTYSINSEIEQAINENFIDSERRYVLDMTSFNVATIVDRMSDNHADRALEMMEESAKDFADEDSHRDIIEGSREEINELFKRD